MARPSKLMSMSVESLMKLRDDIGSVLSHRAVQLQSQLAALDDGGWVTSGRKAAGRPRSKLKGRKVAPKYRNPANRSETWAGRGAVPRWMAAQIKAGKKREDFAIGERMAKFKKSSRKKTRGKRKASTSSRKTPPKSPPVSAEAGS